MQYILPIQDNGTAQRHSATLHIMLAFLLMALGIASLVLFWFTWISPTFAHSGGAYIPFLVFGILSVCFSITILVLTIFQKNWVQQQRNNKALRFVELGLLAGGGIIFLLNNWKLPAALFGLMAAVVVFAIIQESGSAKKGAVLIDETGITFPRKKLDWKEVKRVILRFGTLTVDLNGNKLLQQNIAAHTIAVHELEAFCSQQIETNKVAVVKDW
jgi:hypothetical protein